MRRRGPLTRAAFGRASVIKSRLPYSGGLISPPLLSCDAPTFSSGAKCKNSHATDIRAADKQSGACSLDGGCMRRGDLQVDETFS